MHNLIVVAIGAAKIFGMPHASASDEVLGDLVIALGDVKKLLPYHIAMVRRQAARAVGLFPIMDGNVYLIHSLPPG